MLDNFLWPLVGGALLGLSAAALMLFNGRIAGISGILGGALSRSGDGHGWRWSFLGGLVVGGLLLLYGAGPAVFENTLGRPILLTAIAGLLVGFGARLGSGCTAGHGICGLARLSTRSLVSVPVFVASGAVVTLLIRVVGS